VHKNVSYALVVLAVTMLMVLSVVNSVHTTDKNNLDVPSALTASGSPAPAPVPPAANDSAQVASGSPAPAPVPPAFQPSVLTASGSPAPAPVPPKKLAPLYA
jgi:hypothetical protein